MDLAVPFRTRAVRVRLQEYQFDWAIATKNPPTAGTQGGAVRQVRRWLYSPVSLWWRTTAGRCAHAKGLTSGVGTWRGS